MLLERYKPLIPEENSVWIHHWNYFEHDKFSQTDGDVVGGDKEIKEALDDEGGRSFSWVNPGHDEDHLDLPVVILIVHNSLPITKVVRGRDRDQVYWFLKHSFPQGLFVNIIKLS